MYFFGKEWRYFDQNSLSFVTKVPLDDVLALVMVCCWKKKLKHYLNIDPVLL